MTEFGTYDFGLSAADEQRAARMHRESIVIDLMSWGPLSQHVFSDDMLTHLRAGYEADGQVGALIDAAEDLAWDHAVSGEIDFRGIWDATGITAGQFGFQVGTGEEIAFWAARLSKVLDGNPWVRRALKANDIRRAHEDGEHCYIVHCQPTTPISKDLRLIDQSYAIGLRCLQLTYNDQDLVGTGCTDRTDGGLSNFGLTVVERCNDLGILVDTAHCGRQTTLDACQFSSAPVVATHTGASAVYLHDRGKSDEELEAIAGTGGVIGVVTVPFFIGGGADVGIDVLLDHVDYIVRRVGAEHVAIGSDWPVILPKFVLELAMPVLTAIGFRPEHGVVATQNLVGFDDYRDWPNITRGLVSRGYSDDDIRGIIGGNALRVFEQVWG